LHIILLLPTIGLSGFPYNVRVSGVPYCAAAGLALAIGELKPTLQFVKVSI